MTAPIRSMPESMIAAPDQGKSTGTRVFQTLPEYRIGDRISMVVRRDWLAIWWDRVATLRWRVPLTETRVFECTSVTAGAIWPEVK